MESKNVKTDEIVKWQKKCDLEKEKWIRKENYREDRELNILYMLKGLKERDVEWVEGELVEGGFHRMRKSS